MFLSRSLFIKPEPRHKTLQNTNMFTPAGVTSYVNEIYALIYQISQSMITDCSFVLFVHRLFCQFISWKNCVNSDKFMDNKMSLYGINNENFTTISRKITCTDSKCVLLIGWTAQHLGKKSWWESSTDFVEKRYHKKNIGKFSIF